MALSTSGKRVWVILSSDKGSVIKDFTNMRFYLFFRFDRRFFIGRFLKGGGSTCNTGKGVVLGFGFSDAFAFPTKILRGKAETWPDNVITNDVYCILK